MEGRRFHKNFGSDTVSGGPKGKPTSIILNATATKGSDFHFNHPSTNPSISTYSKISNPKALTPSLRSGGSRRCVGNGFKEWKF